MTTGKTIVLTRWTFVGTLVNTSVEVDNNNSNSNSNTGNAIFRFGQDICVRSKLQKKTTIRLSSEVLQYSPCVIFEDFLENCGKSSPLLCSGCHAGCISQTCMSADLPVDSASGKPQLESRVLEEGGSQVIFPVSLCLRWYLWNVSSHVLSVCAAPGLPSCPSPVFH